MQVIQPGLLRTIISEKKPLPATKTYDLYSAFKSVYLIVTSSTRGMALYLNKLESPSPIDVLCQVWLNWPSGSGNEVQNVKSLQTDRHIGDQRISLELSAKPLE